MATRKTTPKSNVSAEELLNYYPCDMLLIRRFEEKAGQLYGMGLIGGFCHLYIGQRIAVVVGTLEAAAKDGDKRINVLPRSRPYAGLRQWTPMGVISELTGREVGYSKGKGRLHATLSAAKKHFFKQRRFMGIVRDGKSLPVGCPGWHFRTSIAAMTM